jgi:hypothetical protein
MATIHDNDALELHPSRSHLAMDRSPFPDSDQRLLEHVYSYMGPFEIIQRCQELSASGKKIEFWTVSDGSSANGSMSFGWKCVPSDGTPIAYASGSAHRFLSIRRFWLDFCNQMLCPPYRFSQCLLL